MNGRKERGLASLLEHLKGFSKDEPAMHLIGEIVTCLH